MPEDDKLKVMCIGSDGDPLIAEIDNTNDEDENLRRMNATASLIMDIQFLEKQSKALSFSNMEFSIEFFENEDYVEFVLDKSLKEFEELSELIREEEYSLFMHLGFRDHLISTTEKICLKNQVFDISEVLCVSATLFIMLLSEASMYPIKARKGTAIPDFCQECPVLKSCERCDRFEFAQKFTRLNMRKLSLSVIAFMSNVYKDTLRNLLYLFEETFFYSNLKVESYTASILDSISKSFLKLDLNDVYISDRIVFVRHLPTIFETTHLRCGNLIFIQLEDANNSELLDNWIEKVGGFDNAVDDFKLYLSSIRTNRPEEAKVLKSFIESEDKLKKLMLKFSEDNDSGE